MPTAPSPLTPKQLEVLNWIRDGCPEGVYEGYRHRGLARGLADRGLVKVKGRGDDWTAAITDAGRNWKPSDPSPRATTKRAATPSTPAIAARPAVPHPPGDRKQANDLVDQVIAADGHLPLPEGPGERQRHERLVRLSLTSPNRPHGRKLVIVRAGGGWYGPYEIVFTDHFDDLVQPKPVPVPAHVGKYSPEVRVYLDLKDWQYVSAAHLPRAARILEAIVREAPKRGLTVSEPNGPKCHVALGADGTTYEVQIREISAPGGAEVPDTMRRQGPAWTHTRQRAFIAIGQLELVVSGRYATYQGNRYRDTAKVALEAKLPRLFHRLEVYRRQAAAAAEQQRVRAEDRRRRWEAAMAEARERYDAQARWEHFERMSHQQREVAEHRAFLSDARAAAAHYQGDVREAVIAQLDMAERVLGEIDPLRHPELLAPLVREPQGPDLKPFLKGWSPLGPDGS